MCFLRFIVVPPSRVVSQLCRGIFSSSAVVVKCHDMPWHSSLKRTDRKSCGNAAKFRGISCKYLVTSRYRYNSWVYKSAKMSVTLQDTP